MIKELTCICCPMGCSLKAEVENDEVISVSGNNCIRGENYAKSEITAPVRTVTTTIMSDSGIPVPVKTKDPVAKEKIFETVSQIKETSVHLPIKMGEIVIKNVADTGVDIVATRSVK